mgnify:CR=1 FL=1
MFDYDERLASLNRRLQLSNRSLSILLTQNFELLDSTSLTLQSLTEDSASLSLQFEEFTKQLGVTAKAAVFDLMASEEAERKLASSNRAISALGRLIVR